MSQKSELMPLESVNLGAPRVCPLTDALELVGERWSLLVLREIHLGAHRFSDLQTNTGAPRETLASRLRTLEGAGLIRRQRYNDHPPRDQYVLTDAGTDIWDALVALQEWGRRHATPVLRGCNGPA